MRLPAIRPTVSSVCSRQFSQLPYANNISSHGLEIENTTLNVGSEANSYPRTGRTNVESIPSRSTNLEEMFNNVLGGLHEVRILGQVKDQGGNIARLKQRLKYFHDNFLLRLAKRDTTDSSEWAAYFQELSSIDARLIHIAASAEIVLAKATPLSAAQIERQNDWLHNRKKRQYPRSDHYQHEDSKGNLRVPSVQNSSTIGENQSQDNVHRPLKDDPLFSNTITLLRQLQDKLNKDRPPESRAKSNRPQKRRLRADDFF